jgi:uncharacterized membrane protein HdeD (DUF308 family)
VSTVTETADEKVAVRSTGRTVAAVVLGIIGILLVIAAILYFTTPAHSLPSVLGAIAYNGHNHSRAYSHRSLRGIVSIIVGVICLVAAWFAFFWKGKASKESV